MKKAYLLGTCLLLVGATTSSFGSSKLQELESSIPNVSFVDEFLDSKPHGKAGVMWRPWEEAFKKAEMKYDGKNVKFIVLLYTASKDRKNVPATYKERGVSTHFLVDNNGDVINYVDPYVGIAYHSGASSFAGYSRLNYWSIGIDHTGLGCTSKAQNDEFGKPLPGRVIPGSNNYWYEFPEKEFLASCELTKALQNEFKIPGFNVVTHADIAPERKSDIGPMWNYKRAYDDFGVGFFPSETHQVNMANFANITEYDYMSFIHSFGYDSAQPQSSIVKVYQMHYSASNISGELVDDTKRDVIRHVISLSKLGKHGYFNKKILDWAGTNPDKVSPFAEYISIG